MPNKVPERFTDDTASSLNDPEASARMTEYLATLGLNIPAK